VDDPYLDPVTGVLRNLLGATDEATLAAAEGRLAFWREVRAHGELGAVPGNLDLAHLQAVHRWLFGPVYGWAGELRTVSISKGSSLFALPEHLPAAAADLFVRLAADRHLRGLDHEGFAVGAGELLGHLNALHPFREGNGRTQRLFLQLVAGRAGWQLLWSEVTPGEMIAASERAMSELDAFVPMVARIARPSELSIPTRARMFRRPEQEPPAPTL
jgi:cell filamentation protein